MLVSEETNVAFKCVFSSVPQLISAHMEVDSTNNFSNQFTAYIFMNPNEWNPGTNYMVSTPS